MPRLTDSIATDISYIALLSFLQPYMQDVNKFNAHRTEISAAVNAFLTQTLNGEVSPFNADAVLNAYQDKINRDGFFDPESQGIQPLLVRITALQDEMRTQLSPGFSNDLMAIYTTEQSAMQALEEGKPLHIMAHAIGQFNDRDAAEVRQQMESYIKKYFDLKTQLQPYNDGIAANKEASDEQTDNNRDVKRWAENNAQHNALLAHLALKMKINAQIEQSYRMLLSMKTEDADLTPSELANTEKNLCMPAGHIPGLKRCPIMMAEALPFKLVNVAKELSHDYIDLDAQGNPVAFKYERSVSALIEGLGVLLVMGLVLTTVFTLVPVLPDAASTGLNQLYSGLFAASTSPVFSFTEIYLISLAFVVAIDVLVLAGAKYWEKHGVEHKIALKEQYIAPKLEEKVAARADEQVKVMDNHLPEAHRPTRQPMIAAYGQLTAKKEPVAKQQKPGLSALFIPSMMR